MDFPQVSISTSEGEDRYLHSLLRECQAVIFLFLPYLFGNPESETGMHAFLVKLNGSLDAFKERDIRVVCVTKDHPCSIRQYAGAFDFKFEIISDPNLAATRSLSRVVDINKYFTIPNDELGLQGFPNYAPCVVPWPAAVIVGGSLGAVGTILGTHFSAINKDIDLFDIELFDLIRMTGLAI